MKLIEKFKSLPDVLINIILSYNEYFKIRKGKLITIISKNDFRYSILNKITLSFVDRHYLYNNIVRYEYNYNENLIDFEEKTNQNIQNDMIQVDLEITPIQVIYNIFIGRIKLFDNNYQKKSIYYKGDLKNLQWNYTNYRYIRN
jgi:hypothetical protein